MFYYVSDLHFGHKNILEMCKRPFSSIEEMDERLVENWNKRVKKNDKVYILGDLIYKSTTPPEAYLERLKGEKVLILGNHDKWWVDKVDLTKYFSFVMRLDVINTGKGKATLCHFPMMDFEGRYLIHGHIHANTDMDYWSVLKNSDRTLNAGVDVNGFQPVTFDELLENNLRFKKEH